MDHPFPTVLAEAQKINRFLQTQGLNLAPGAPTGASEQAGTPSVPSAREVIYHQILELQAKTGRMPTSVRVTPEVYRRLELECGGREPTEIWGMDIWIVDIVDENE